MLMQTQPYNAEKLELVLDIGNFYAKIMNDPRWAVENVQKTVNEAT